MRPDHRRPAGDVDDVGHQRHRAGADGEAEQRRRRSAGPSRPPIRRPASRITSAASRPRASPSAGRWLLEREEQVAARLDPQRRVLAQVVEDALRRSRSSARQVLALGVLDPDQGDPPVGRDDAGVDGRLAALGEGAGRVARAEHVRAARRRPPGPRRRRPAPRASRRSVARSSRGVERPRRRSAPSSSAPAWRQQLGWPAASRRPGASNGSSSSRPNAAAEARTTSADREPARRSRAHGRRAAKRPSRSSARDMVVSLGTGGSASGASRCLHGRPDRGLRTSAGEAATAAVPTGRERVGLSAGLRRDRDSLG